MFISNENRPLLELIISRPFFFLNFKGTNLNKQFLSFLNVFTTRMIVLKNSFKNKYKIGGCKIIVNGF